MNKTNVRLKRNPQGVWEIRWREEAANDKAIGKRRSLRTRCEQEAQRRLSHFILVGSKKTAYTVADAWQIRQDESLKNTADPARIRYAWKALLPFFGDKDVTALTQADVNEYVEDRTDDGRELSTIRRELGELLTTLKAMVDSRRVPYDSVPKLTLPTAQNTRPNYLSERQKADMLAKARERRQNPREVSRLELFLHIGLETGQRRRAIETLEWSQVDFTARIIHFRKVGEPLTKKRKPSVPMSEALQAVLLEEYAQRQTPFVLRHPGSIRTSFDNLVEALGYTDVTPHSLRHTFVSHLLMRGHPIYDVAQLVGMTVRMIETTYGHLTPEHLRRLLD